MSSSYQAKKYQEYKEHQKALSEDCECRREHKHCLEDLQVKVRASQAKDSEPTQDYQPEFVAPGNLVSTRIAVLTVPATEYSRDNISEDGDITAKQQQRITSFIGGNVNADKKVMILFAERETFNNDGCIALLESAPVINVPTKLEIEYNPMEQIDPFNWFFSIDQLNELVLYMMRQNQGLVALDGYKEENLRRTGKPYTTLANYFASTMSRYPLPGGTQLVFYTTVNQVWKFVATCLRAYSNP